MGIAETLYSMLLVPIKHNGQNSLTCDTQCSFQYVM